MYVTLHLGMSQDLLINTSSNNCQIAVQGKAKKL